MPRLEPCQILSLCGVDNVIDTPMHHSIENTKYANKNAGVCNVQALNHLHLKRRCLSVLCSCLFNKYKCKLFCGLGKTQISILKVIVYVFIHKFITLCYSKTMKWCSTSCSSELNLELWHSWHFSYNPKSGGESKNCCLVYWLTWKIILLLLTPFKFKKKSLKV